MGTSRYASVLGLGFGDCGKGRFVDLLTRRWQAHTVVRFNGGAQAGHNVVTTATAGSPGLHHTFSQFGSGTLVPGTRTMLVDPMILHPTALLIEAGVLAGIGVHDALVRLDIDACCRVTTPYHQAAGRLRERLRGGLAHGTCGVGVGETVRHALAHPDQVLRYGDCAPAGTARTGAVRDRLLAIRETLLAELQSVTRPPGWNLDEADDFLLLQDEGVGARWIPVVQALARQCPPAPPEILGARLARPGCVLFEGAQGVLLDEWRGFHPHTTWSSTGTSAVEDVARRFGIEGPIQHLGVLRSYLTRHGQGPFPTHDPSLDDRLPEPHNPSSGWQGAFRRGHPDAVLLRYALETVGPLSGLLVSHLDAFRRRVALRWCDGYTVTAGHGECASIDRLPVGPPKDLDHQRRLTRVLESARPSYASDTVGTPGAFLERIAGLTPLPVVLRSHGATTDEAP